MMAGNYYDKLINKLLSENISKKERECAEKQLVSACLKRIHEINELSKRLTGSSFFGPTIKERLGTFEFNYIDSNKVVLLYVTSCKGIKEYESLEFLFDYFNDSFIRKEIDNKVSNLISIKESQMESTNDLEVKKSLKAELERFIKWMKREK